jgi:hypothetical protein
VEGRAGNLADDPRIGLSRLVALRALLFLYREVLRFLRAGAAACPPCLAAAAAPPGRR